MKIKCFLHASWGCALCAVFASLAAVAVDLPWVYDSSARTVAFRTLPFAVSSVMQRGRAKRASHALPILFAAFAAAVVAAAALLITARSPAPRHDAARAAGETRPPAVVRSLTLPPSARKAAANLTLERGSPPAQVETTFLDAGGAILSHESRPVKKHYTRALPVPHGAVSVRFAVLRLPEGAEPKIKTFAPSAVQDSTSVTTPATTQ